MTPGIPDMTFPPNETKKEFLKADEISTSELVNRYGIPREELASFQQGIRLYPAGGTIMQEDNADKTLFFLKWGSVGIFRKVGNSQERIATIEAPNFVGEMSMINNEPRSATVIAQSEGALVYVLGKPNLSQILANPKWSELLVTRLSRNLAQSSNQVVNLMAVNKEQKIQIERMQVEHEQFKKNTILAFAAIWNFEHVITDLAVVGSKGWVYLKTLTDVTKALITYYMPNVKVYKEAAEKKAMQDCLDTVRTTGTGSVYTELSKSL
jgi:CRP/FNR family transcriptional regulator, cyclic AMP receptor protein